MQTILVTGGAGYIGSHIALLLAQQGMQVIILDSCIYGQKPHYPWATLITGDIADVTLLRTIFTTYTIYAVVHCAAFIEVGESVKNPLLFYDNNVTKTLTLLSTMLEYGITRFIFSSSCAVYGVPTDLPLQENHPHKPISPYGKTKAVIESVLQDMSTAYGLRYIALRYFNAAGALPEYNLGEHHLPETHLIPLVLRAAYEQTSINLYGTDYETKDGTAVRDYVHVLDIAQAHSKALEHIHNDHPSDAFNLGTGHGFSVKEIIETAERICRMPIKVNLCKARAGDPALLVADPTHAYEILQWRPRHSTLELIMQSAFIYEHQLRSKKIAEQYI